ncbi:MAG: hypothetical protein ABIL09_25085 [Gemmatimonadota bacterium]
MAAKIIGALLLAAGVVLGLKFVGLVAAGVLSFILLLLKGAVVAGLVWWGWVWVSRAEALLKVLGALLLAGGIVAAVPLFGLLMLETLSLVWLAVKGVVVGVLVYAGWRLLNRDDGYTLGA